MIIHQWSNGGVVSIAHGIADDPKGNTLGAPHLYPQKSLTIQQIKRRGSLEYSERWILGTELLSESSNFTHLGLKWIAGRLAQDMVVKVYYTCTPAYAIHDGCRFHGKFGLDTTSSLKIMTTYIVPRLLYVVEATGLTKQQIGTLSTYHRCLLCQIQCLPKETAIEAVCLLLGTSPLEAQIHIRVLSTGQGRKYPTSNAYHCTTSVLGYSQQLS